MSDYGGNYDYEWLMENVFRSPYPAERLSDVWTNAIGAGPAEPVPRVNATEDDDE